MRKSLGVSFPRSALFQTDHSVGLHAQGFIASTHMKLEGDEYEARALLIATILAFTGLLIASPFKITNQVAFKTSLKLWPLIRVIGHGVSAAASR